MRGGECFWAAFRVPSFRDRAPQSGPARATGPPGGRGRERGPKGRASRPLRVPASKEHSPVRKRRGAGMAGHAQSAARPRSRASGPGTGFGTRPVRIGRRASRDRLTAATGKERRRHRETWGSQRDEGGPHHAPEERDAKSGSTMPCRGTPSRTGAAQGGRRRSRRRADKGGTGKPGASPGGTGTLTRKRPARRRAARAHWRRRGPGPSSRQRYLARFRARLTKLPGHPDEDCPDSLGLAR